MKTQTNRQITVALENRPGQLAKVCRLLAENGINIEAISAVEGVEYGVIRITTSDQDRCRQILQQNQFFTAESDVLVLELSDKIGTRARLGAALAGAQLNIDYLYGSLGQPGASTRVILKTSDLSRAHAVLEGVEE